MAIAGIVIVLLNSQKDDGVVINLAGKQRMLTQKMSKEALALSQGVGSKESLEQTMNLFDRTLKGLISGDAELNLPPTQNPESLSQLNHVRELWKVLHTNLDITLANSGETTAALSYINENNIHLLKEMNKAVVMLEKKAADPVTINLAGKQRMLTQKMVKETLGLVQGTVSGDTLKSTSTLFDKTLKGLISGDSELGLSEMKDTAVLAQLTNIQSLWKSFYENVKKVLQLAPETNDALAYVNGHNVKILKEMDKAVGMYERQTMHKAAILQWSNTIVVIITVITVILAWIVVVRPLIKTLTDIISNLSTGADQVASASEQISSSSQSLAQGSSEQASSIEETSASMEQMSSMTKQNANNSREAAKLVDMCSASAENGNRAIGDMSKSMEEINGSSKKIAEITKVIDGIAFQTNLLALNAAVEAARAGEHGKGFAVVAEEVRNLAQRSATAAKDTTSLIEDCVNKTDNGVKISGKCREALQDIVKNVKKATNLTKEITNASSEQSDGIGQVNNAVQQMDQVTQQNAANAEETAAASEEMSAQAQSLMEQVKMLSSLVGGAGNGARHNPHYPPLQKGGERGDSPLAYRQAGFTKGKNPPSSPFSKGENPPSSPFSKGGKRGIGKSPALKNVSYNKAVDDGNGNKDVPYDTDHDAIIPMNKDKISERDDRFKDF